MKSTELLAPRRKQKTFFTKSTKPRFLREIMLSRVRSIRRLVVRGCSKKWFSSVLRMGGPKTMADCLELLAKDPASADRLAARQSTDGRAITYAEFYNQVSDMAGRLKACFPGNDGKRPICLMMDRNVGWYICYISCSKVGIPVVGASIDLPDKKAEKERWTEIVNLLDPLGVVTGGPEVQVTGYDGPVISISDLMEGPMVSIQPSDDEPTPILGYHFTGGTTAEPNCVVITHAMAVHEILNYPSVLPPQARWPESVLQNSSMHWPASAFGQLDIALAFGACAVLSVSGGCSPEHIARLIETEKIECVGVGPSVLSFLDPERTKSLSLVFTWGECLPKSLACDWCDRVDLIDLLISTEYWLSFYAIITRGDDWVYRSVLETKIHLEELEMRHMIWLAGPMVSPNYISGPNDMFKTIGNETYFCTKDTAMDIQSADNGEITFRYAGRSDNFIKINRKLVDLYRAAREVTDRIGHEIVEDCVFVRDSYSGVHAVFVLTHPIGLDKLLLAVQENIPSVKPGQVHVLSTMPRNVATHKLDMKALVQLVSDPSLQDPQYPLHDKSVPAKGLPSVPNDPH